MSYENRWETVDVKVEDGIAWVTLNRPEKKNAMSPTLNREMIDVLETLELDQNAKVLVLTGAGDSWTAGMDLKEYFREVDTQPEIFQERIRRDSCRWQWQLLRMYSKPTIAMVNGWCFGGGFSPLVACDLAIAADEATFGLSEINWGIPTGQPCKQSNGRYGSVIVHSVVLHHDGQNSSGGKEAETMGLVNKSVPLAQLKAEVTELANCLLREKPCGSSRTR
ncbi:p-hydroxycinnamoyl CoA hydratase/lyase [Acinetobacter baumannii]